MINTQYINLNMIPSGVMPVLHVSQNDIGRPLGMVVYNGGEAVDLDSYTCTIEATRTDGTAITAAVTTDDNIGAFVTTATMTNQADKYPAKLVLFDSNSRRVASLAFIMCVTPATMDENAESIEEDRTLYQQYTGTVQTIIAEIRSDLAAEISRAQTKENSLQSAISAETSARATAVSAEATARATAVSAEAAAREAADNALSEAISKEAATRAAADTSLQSQINQLVAPTGEAPSAAEVQNARIGADGKTYATLGDAIRAQDTDLTQQIMNYNAYDFLQRLEHFNQTNFGITWAWNGNACTVTGTATATANNDLYSSATTMPDGISAGGKYYIYYSSEKVNLRIYAYAAGGTPTEILSTKNDTEITIPTNTVGLIIRLNVPSGDTVNEIVKPVMLKAFTNEYLSERLKRLYNGIMSMNEIALFEKGTIENGKNSAYGQSGRARTKDMLLALNDLQIIAKVETFSNARVFVFVFNANGTVMSSSGWKTEATIVKGSLFRIVLTYDYTDITTTYSIGDIFNCFSYNDYVNVSSRIITHADLKQIKSLFEHGGYDNTTGGDSYFHGDARARTIGILECDQDIFVECKAGVYAIAYYDNGVYTGEEGATWLDYGVVIPRHTQFKIMVTPDGTATNFISLHDIVKNIGLRIVSPYEYSLNPNIIFQARNVSDSAFPPYSKWYIRAAAVNQYDRVRVNVRVTTDGYYVLIHNTTINAEARNPDGSEITEQISSNGQTLATLNGYDWGIKYGSKYAGYGVPTLEEACKYAAMYNMGLTIETSFYPTQEQVTEMAAIIGKYGLLSNLIVIAVNSQIVHQDRWINVSKMVSFAILGTYEYLSENVSAINAFKTGQNTIYTGALPWPSVVSDEIRNLAIAQGWKLYCGMVMNKADLFNTVGFDKGYSLIEANNLYRIKDTIRDYADALLDS